MDSNELEKSSQSCMLSEDSKYLNNDASNCVTSLENFNIVSQEQHLDQNLSEIKVVSDIDPKLYENSCEVVDDNNVLLREFLHFLDVDGETSTYNELPTDSYAEIEEPIIATLKYDTNFITEDELCESGSRTLCEVYLENNNCVNTKDLKDTVYNTAKSSCDSPSSISLSEHTGELNYEIHQENIHEEESVPHELIQTVDNEFIAKTVKYYEDQLEEMKNSNVKLQSDISDMRTKFHNQEIEWKTTELKLKSELLSKIEMLSKERSALQKDKESMVIRYANSEKEVILEKKAQSDLEKKMKEINKERENLSTKVKGLVIEKNRLCSVIDSKMVELSKFQRENEKLKEDFSARDIKIKWLQNKLKTEVSSHKDTQNKLEYNMQRINEMREEAEQVRRDCQEMIKRYQDAEELKSIKLDSQLKQKLSELEVQRQEKSDQEQVYQLLRQELEALKKKQRLTIEENNSLTLKIHGLEKERLEYEQTLSKLKDSQNILKQEVVDLAAQLTEMENLQLQLEREKDKSAASLREVDRLRSTNAELQADMDACHLKEGELLEFTKIVTQKTVQLQSDHSLLEIRAQALEDENKQLNRQFLDLQVKYLQMSQNLENTKKEKQEETQLLARKLAEKTRIVDQLNVKLDEAANENRVMRKRHIASIKELSRELQQCKHKLESFEINKCTPEESTSLGSRASSTTSLEVIPSCSPFGNNINSETEISPPVAFSGGKTSLNLYDKKAAVSSTVISEVVDKKTLIDRIIRLQENIARKEDKIEFLEDHNEQLVQEMKKKTKIIQSYIVKEETGALTSNSSDENKILLSKRGGIMASVYTSLLSDSNMTLELSLEINQKLQAVLEDTLLKNITLKENVNTLGEEIARLTTEHRQFSKQLKRQKSLK